MRSLFEADEPPPSKPTRDPDPDEDMEALLEAVDKIRTRYLTGDRSDVVAMLLVRMESVLRVLARDMEKLK